MAQLQQMREEARRAGMDASAIDRALEEFRKLNALPSLSDPRAEQALAGAVQQLKEYEFQINKSIAGDAQGGIRVQRNSDVLPEYKKQAEEYLRQIGKTPTPDKGDTSKVKPIKPPGGR